MKTVVIGAFYGNAGNIKGADNGARRLKYHLENSSMFFLDGGDVEIIQNSNLKGEECLEEVVDVCQRIKTLVITSIGKGYPTLILGGDHSISLGSISAAAEIASHNKKRFGVIYIDAHGDINTLKSSLTKNIHGTALAACMGFGEQKMTELVTTPLNPQNLLLIGTRSLEPAEKKLIDEQKIAVISADEINVDYQQSTTDIINKVASFIDNRNLQQVHLSVDVDAIDPSEAPGTGVPEPNGISSVFVRDLVEYISRISVTMTADFVEYNPSLDIMDATFNVSADICRRMLIGMCR